LILPQVVGVVGVEHVPLVICSVRGARQKSLPLKICTE
jgi:hypothetical protein